jgi:hypothetical protein
MKLGETYDEAAAHDKEPDRNRRDDLLDPWLRPNNAYEERDGAKLEIVPLRNVHISVKRH